MRKRHNIINLRKYDKYRGNECRLSVFNGNPWEEA